MMNPAQIKQERFEDYQQQQRQQQVDQYNPYGNGDSMPKIMKGVSGAVFQHVGNTGRDMVIIEDIQKRWRCLAFREAALYPGVVSDMKIAFPVGCEILLNAELVNPEKSIQYIATLVWRPQHYGVADVQGRDVLMNDEHYMKYYEVLKTIGKVLDTVAKLPLGKTESLSIGGQIVSKSGVVRKLLDENFGLIQIPEGLALFDTCDFWVAPKASAAKMGKKLEDVISVGTKVTFHACMIDKTQKINFLATAVWHELNTQMKQAQNMPLPIKRDEINATKIDIYQKVVESVSDSLNDIPAPPSTNQVESAKIDPTSCNMWEHAIIKAVVYDKNRKLNGGIVAGVARISQFSTQVRPSYGFFLTKHFVKIDAVPSVGMEEYVTLYPVAKLPNAELFGQFDFIVLALYPTFMGAGSVGRKDAFQIQSIVQECQETLRIVLEKYPGMQDVGNYLRYYYFCFLMSNFRFELLFEFVKIPASIPICCK